MGRPTKFTQTVRAAILGSIENGASETAAAEAAGVGRTTLQSWKKRGEEEPEGPYGAFLEGITRARAQAELDLVAVVRGAAAEGDWKAALEMLARRNPEEWGRKDMTEHRVEKRLLEVLTGLKGQVSEGAYAELSRALLAYAGADSAGVPRDGDPDEGDALN